MRDLYIVLILFAGLVVGCLPSTKLESNLPSTPAPAPSPTPTPSPSPGPSPSPAPTPSTTYLYRVGTDSDQIFYANVDLSTGVLTEQTAASLGPTCTQPSSVVVTPDKAFMYVGCYGNSKIALFSLNSSTGVPTYVDEYGIVGQPLQLVINSAGTLLYEITNGNILSYTLTPSTGFLFLANSVLFAGGGGTSMALDATDSYLYAGYGSGVRLYVLDSAGAMVETGPVMASVAIDLKINPANNRLFVAKGGGDFLNIAVSATTGAMTFTDFQPASPSSPFSVHGSVFNSAGTVVYTLKNYEGTIEVFAVNVTTGEHTLIDTETLPSGCSPKSASILATDDFLFTGCTDSSGKTISYAINSDGTLQSTPVTNTTSGVKVMSSVLVQY